MQRKQCCCPQLCEQESSSSPFPVCPTAPAPKHQQQPHNPSTHALPWPPLLGNPAPKREVSSDTVSSLFSSDSAGSTAAAAAGRKARVGASGLLRREDSELPSADKRRAMVQKISGLSFSVSAEDLEVSHPAPSFPWGWVCTLLGMQRARAQVGG